jgi:hypothetical protein
MSKNNDVFTMSLDALDKHVAQLLRELSKAKSALEGLVRLTSEERRDSPGKFRKGEADALLSVLDAAEAKPALFESLADRDFGADPSAFEIGVLRDRLQRVDKLAPVADELEKFSTLVSDTVMQITAETKPVMQEAYGIAKSVAKTDDKLRATIAPAIDYYKAIARRSAETRKRNEQKKANAGAGAESN